VGAFGLAVPMSAFLPKLPAPLGQPQPSFFNPSQAKRRSVRVSLSLWRFFLAAREQRREEKAPEKTTHKDKTSNLASSIKRQVRKTRVQLFCFDIFYSVHFI